MVFKCKLCGGDLDVEKTSSIGTCQFCGTTQTLPKLNNNKRTNLYERANHLRRQNEFDKAAELYEQILNEDTSDCEAYWSLVLCQYGVEYVEDPTTKKRVPTCNRTQLTSILADENYKQALTLADQEQQSLYKEEAAQIDSIQKGILEISNKEDPFDVFICYKESDDAGNRTQDSVLAQQLYHELTDEGFKVFFSRITLEEKLGSAYEPYIFAALQSSSAMVVIGTNPEYFNAVWVKNEWSRYLGLIKGGKKKILIPAYRDMDPYNLPVEFSNLQAQDMGKLGFVQDLVRGIKKVISTEKSGMNSNVVASSEQANKAASLLQRAYIELEDGNWEKAESLLEQVLDNDPQNSKAYTAKLLINYNLRKIEDLETLNETFADNVNYQRAVRFADEKYKEVLKNYCRSVAIRLELARKQRVYDSVMQSIQQLPQTRERSNILRRYSHECGRIASVFETLPGFLDSDDLAREYQQEAEKAISLAGKALEKEKKKKKEKLILKISLGFGIPLIVIVLLISLISISISNAQFEKEENKISILEASEKTNNNDEAQKKLEIGRNKKYLKKYEKAEKLLNSGKYAAAIKAFDKIGGYKYGDHLWKILEIKNGKGLLISQNAIENTPFTKDMNRTMWENCTLRTYLNEDFFNKRFNTEEQEGIVESQVPNINYGPWGGDDTKDYIFLLSVKELNHYFPELDDRKVEFNGKKSEWWLRTPGYADPNAGFINASFVSKKQKIDDKGDVRYNKGLRPAMWINL